MTIDRAYLILNLFFTASRTRKIRTAPIGNGSWNVRLPRRTRVETFIGLFHARIAACRERSGREDIRSCGWSAWLRWGREIHTRVGSKARWRRPHSRPAATGILVYFDPAAFVPVTAALMFSPAVPFVLVFSPSPIVGMNDDPVFRLEMMDFPDMPAIAFAIARNFSGCGGCHQSQPACCAQDRGEDSFHK
jgi:hypothetical protein